MGLVGRGVQDGRLVATAERPTTSEHFVHHDTQGPQVGPPVHARPVRLLGAHVRDGSQRRPVTGHRDVLQPRQTEVHDLRQAAIGKDDVARLDVAVDDALVVGALESAGNLDGVFQRVVNVQRAVLDLVLEGLAGVVRHRDEELALVTPRDLVDYPDVRVVEGTGRPGLPRESGLELRVRGIGPGEELQGHRPLQRSVLGLVHESHAALAEALQDPVLLDLPADHGIGAGRRGVRGSHAGWICGSLPGPDNGAVPP